MIPRVEVGNYKQDKFVQKLLAETFDAHNAIEDVLSLQKLFNLKLKSLSKNDDIFNLSHYTWILLLQRKLFLELPPKRN